MTEYRKPSDVVEAVGISGVLSAGLTWHVIGQGLAWAEFDKPADAVKYTMSKKGKGRKYAVMAFTPGKEFSGVVYLTSVKRGLEAGQVVSESQLLDLYHGQEEKAATEKVTEKAAKKTSQASEKKPAEKAVKTAKKAAQKPAKDTGFAAVTLDQKEIEQAPLSATKEKAVNALTTQKRPKSKSRARLEASRPAAKKASPQKPAPKSTGLQFGPALVADKDGKATIASLLHAGKAYASRTVPAEFSARFKKYSYDNQLLLYLQGGPNLGQVSTYRGWLKQGRQVTRGQHGLKILAPRMVPDEKGNPKIDGLRLVTLFSIEQTEEAKKEA